VARRYCAGWPMGEAGGVGNAGAEADGWTRGKWKKKKQRFNFQIQNFVLPELQKLPKIYRSKIKLPRTQCNNKNSKSY
jgi:hypothetical protein